VPFIVLFYKDIYWSGFCLGKFEGWYFKHQKNDKTLCLIPGLSEEGAFIQVLTQDAAYKVNFEKEQFRRLAPAIIGENKFGLDGVAVNIKTPELKLSGKIRYRYANITPLKYHIMGPFRFVPMQCTHDVLSMSHDLYGSLCLNGETIDFTGGKGYIEGDSGTSFPEGYTWAQAGDFPGYGARDISIMAAAAKIPFAFGSFWGTICVVQIDGVPLRLATYLGAKILSRTDKRLEIKQGDSLLSVEVDSSVKALSLPAPENGTMSRIIHETPSCTAWFKFEHKGRLLVDAPSPYASYEFCE